MVNNEKGMALVLTMLIVSILTVIVVDFFGTAYVDLSIAANYRDGLQAEYISRAGINAGKGILVQDSKSKKPYDSHSEPWALTAIPYPVDEGQVLLEISDDSAKMNPNNLVKSDYKDKWYNTFIRLFEELGVEVVLVDAIADWIDEDSENREWGAESDHYLSLDPPYEAKDGALDTLEELRLIKGVTDEVYDTLKPYLTVTSGQTININTASAPVLSALSDEIDSSLAEEIIEYRKKSSFENRFDIKNVSGITGDMVTEFQELIDNKSNHFTIRATGHMGEVVKINEAKVARSGGTVKVLQWRAD